MLTIKIKLILAVTLIFTLFLGLSLVSASDIDIDDTVSLNDNNNIKTSSSSIAIDDVEANMNDDNGLGKDSNPTVASTNAGDGEIVKDSSNSKTITDLNKTINSGNSTILLDDNYIYNQATDSRFINQGGIKITSDLTIDGQGHTIDLGGKIRFLNVTGSVTLKNINIINGYASQKGGAIYMTGKGSIINSTFSNNRAQSGGVIWIEGNCSVINSTFSNNKNSYYGGAIYLTGICSIINSTFSDNQAEWGGVIYIDNDNGRQNGNCSVINSTFTNNNVTSHGGAIYYYSGILNVTTSKFTDNFGNIVYYKSKDNIYVDDTTRSLSDPDLICNKIAKITVLNNETYESGPSILINVTGEDQFIGPVYGVIYAVYGPKTYIGYIINGTGSIDLSGLSAGSYKFNITYNGTDSDSWAKFRKLSVKLTIYKSEDVDMDVSASNITYGEDGLVNIAFNQTVQGLAYFIYNNKTYSVNISGDSGFITVPGLMPGDYSFDVNFNSSKYKANMKTVNFAVFKKDPEMDVSVANITYGEDAVIFVNFKEALNGTVYLIYNNVNYTGNITNGKGNITIKGLNANDYNLNVIMDETTIYNATNAPAIFTVLKSNSTISVSADDVEYGKDVIVNVTTTCEDGDIYLVINNQTYTGHISNGVGIINVIGLEPGYYNTNVTYNGSVNYNPCVAPVNFTVLKRNATVTTKIDIVDGDVLISVNTDGDHSVAYVIINNVTYSTDIVNHTGFINITGLDPGYYEVNLTYNGSIHYNPSVILFNFTIKNKTNSTINVNVKDVVYPGDVILNVTTHCDDGLIFVEYNGQTYTGNIKGGEGLIRIPGLDPGFYELNVTYNGSKTYNPCVVPVNFTIERINTTLIISKVEVTEDNVLITVSTPGPDSIAYVVINGQTYTGDIVNNVGVINITGLQPGYYVANVTYNGTKYYNPCNASVNFTFGKNESSITVIADDVVYPGNVIISVSTDCDNGLIFVELNGQTYNGYIVNGNGNIIVPDLEPGFYELNVTYNGSDKYKPCVAPVNFTVLKQNATVTTKVDIVGGDVLITVIADGDDSIAYVTINNVTYSTNIINLTGVINITGLEPGYYEANVTYNGTKYYNPCVAPVNFTVGKNASSIKVNVEDVVYPGDVILNVTTDCDDGLIFVEFNGQTYTGNIRGGEGLIRIPGLEPGFYELNVTYNGSEKYYPCVVPVNFTVEKMNTTLIISKVEVTGDNVLITVSTPGPDSVAYVVINGQTFTGDIVNNVGVINITGLEPGYYEANVTYNGTKYYNPCNASVNFTFGKNASSITVTADDVVYPGDVILNVTTDCDDGLIFVEVNGKTYTGNIIGGNGSIIIPALEPGFYELNVTYNGSAKYDPCVAPVNFTVLKQNATVTTKVDIVGGDVLITVFTDGDDSVAYVTINNVTYSTNIVNLTGVINISGLKPGNYTLNLTYNGSNHYNPTVVPVNFTINKKPTSISASATTIVLNYAKVYKVTFNPKLAGFKITFKLNGKIVGSAITDASGVAKITLSAAKLKAARAGKRNMVVSFAGDDTYLASNITKTITINKEATKFINVKSVKKSYKSTDKAMQLTATLKNSKNKIIKNQVVYFKVNNKKNYKVKTNSKGVAKLTLNAAQIKVCKLNKKGNYKFTVTYKTTATYKQASKNGILKVLK